MKTKLILLLIFLMAINTAVWANVGDYERKSVTALDVVWVQPEARRMVNSWDFDLNRFSEFLSFYLEMPRFDYNIVDEQIISGFLNKANSLSVSDPESISGVIEETVVPQILSILNDPEVKRLRSGNFKDEAEYQSMAVSKAKVLGMTLEELEVYMNSAYIYLPYLSSAELVRDDEGNETVELEGGILWWQVKTDESGNTSIVQILAEDTSTFSFVDRSEDAPDTFVFGTETWDVTPVERAVNNAMLAFAKNLSVKTKVIDVFKLSAQIVEAEKSTYGFQLGSKEGIHLDDGFYIVEYVETPDGDQEAVEKGFVRVSKTGNNLDDKANLSYATYLMGERAELGDTILEHPRLGVDASLDVSYVMGSNITTVHAPIAEDSTSLININTSFDYNLAPITNISQFFATLDLGIGIPVADTLSSSAGTFFTLVTSPYLGVSKSFGGRAFVNAGVGIGFDILVINYVDIATEASLSTYSPGVKIDVAGGYMVTPDLSIIGNVGYKVNLPPLFGKREVNGVEYDITTDNYSDMSLGGVSIGIGVRYALGELPFNLFGFLDPLKKY